MGWQLVGNIAGKDALRETVAELKSEIAALRVSMAATKSAAVDSDGLTRLIAEQVGRLPIPKDGRDGVSIDRADVEAIVEKAVAALPKPRDGRDLSPQDVAPMIATEVTKAVDGIAKPKDGRDGSGVTVDDVAPLIKSAVASAVSAIPPVKDGIGVTGGLIDRAGRLVLTFSDGTAKDVGLVAGKDADPAEMRRVILDEVAKIPRPKDGTDGKDGLNGFGFDDFDVVHDGERGFTFRFTKDGRTKDFAFRLPVVIYRGVHESGKTYECGDQVTAHGSTWTAMADTKEVPGEGATAWVLSAKRGRDGKPGQQGEKGMDGRPGKDLTQMDSTGKKW